MSKPFPKPQTFGAKQKKRSFWFHLHFWIGWIAALPIALVCLTGAVLIFEGELFQWDHSEFFQLEETGTPLSIQQVLDRYESANPPLRVNHLGIPRESDHAYSAFCTEIRPEGNRGARVFLNQYTGELTWMGDDFSFAHLMVDIHRHLAAGKTGQLIVALSSVVLAVTCLVGLVLWWPLRGRTFVRAWKRGQALDWHNALGLVALAPLIVMAVTGVTFTWGRHVWPLLENLQGQPSQVESSAVTVSEGDEKLSMDPIVEQIRSEMPEQRITGIQPGNGPQSPYKIILDTGSHNLQLFIDPYTGEELARHDGTGTGPVGWYRRHFGRFHTFGPYPLFWRVLWGLLSLGGTILVATGLWVSIKRWRRRRRAEGGS